MDDMPVWIQVLGVIEVLVIFVLLGLYAVGFSIGWRCNQCNNEISFWVAILDHKPCPHCGHVAIRKKQSGND
jgi:rRNA maturation endonuclease Nob1